MEQLFQIVLTACLTLLGGGVLYVFSQFLSELIIKPYIEFRRVLSEITFRIILYLNLIVSGHPDDDFDQHQRISRKVRELSARLRASVTSLPIPFLIPSLLRGLGLIPCEKQIQEASSLLIRISNDMLRRDKNYDRIYEDLSKIGSLLRIDVGRH